MCFACLEPFSRALVIDFTSILKGKWRMLYMDYFSSRVCVWVGGGGGSCALHALNQ